MLNIIMINLTYVIAISILAFQYFEIKSKKHIVLGCIMIASISIWIDMMLNSQFHYIVLFLLSCFFAYFLFQDSMVYVGMVLSSFTVGIAVSEQLFYYSSHWDENQMTLYPMLGTIIVLFIFMLLHRLKTLRVIHMKEMPKITMLLAISPMMTLLVLLRLQGNYIFTFHISYSLLLLLGLFLSNLIMLVMMGKFVDYITKQKEEEIKRVKIEKNQERLQELLKQQNESLHKVRKDAVKMQSLLEEENYVELKYHLHETFMRTIRYENLITSNCQIIDTLMNEQFDEIEQLGIHTRVILKCTIFPRLEENVIKELLKLLLDFAIFECGKVNEKEKYLRMMSKQHARQVILTIEFSSCGKDKIEMHQYEKISKICEQHELYLSLVDHDDAPLSTITILLQS